MHRLTFAFLGLFNVAFIQSALAEEGSAPFLPEIYKVATQEQNSDSVGLSLEGQSVFEGPQVVDGTGDMVIAPTFDGGDGNTSFIRLVNIASTAQTTTVRVIGSPSGDLYGTADISVPGRASPQYSYSDLLGEVGVSGVTGDDTGLSFYLSSSNILSGFQHVIFNGDNQFFENMSVCRFDGTTNYSALDQVLVNIHTTTLASFPSTVSIHNYSNAQTTAQVDVYEGAEGALKGSVLFTADANASYVLPFSWFQDEVSWEPSGSEFHGNLVFTMQDDTDPPITAGHTVQNQEFNAALNLTQVCAINFGTNVVAGGGSSYTTPDFIESDITSDFDGWSGDTIFELQNDQVWQQAEFSFESAFAFSPDAIIFLDGLSYKMAVDGVDDWVEVRRLVCANSSPSNCAGGNGSIAPDYAVDQVSGTFNGWSNGRTINLTNGQVWEQTSFDTSLSILLSPNVVIYDSGINFTMAIEGEGDWVTVVRIQ